MRSVNGQPDVSPVASGFSRKFCNDGGLPPKGGSYFGAPAGAGTI